jgi:hypothetical protein
MLHERDPVDDLQEPLAEGIVTGHPNGQNSALTRIRLTISSIFSKHWKDSLMLNDGKILLSVLVCRYPRFS